MKDRGFYASGEIDSANIDDKDASPIRKRALLKLDLILLSTVTVIYFLNFLDRYGSWSCA